MHHRLPLIAGALWLAAGPAVLHAQPPWPAEGVRSPASLGVSRASAEAAASRRITPRQGATEAAQQSAPPLNRRTPSPWTAFGSLAVIVVVVLAAARLWKKHGPAIRIGLPQEALEVLGKRQLDRRHAIQMVRCGSRILILGVSDEGLRTLAEITDPVEVDYFAGVCRRSEPGQDFGQSFLSIFNHSRETNDAETEPEMHGRVDRILAERFSQSAPPLSPQGSAARV